MFRLLQKIGLLFIGLYAFLAAWLFDQIVFRQSVVLVQIGIVQTWEWYVLLGLVLFCLLVLILVQFLLRDRINTGL